MLEALRMSNRLRWLLPGVVYEVTTRTIQERYLLTPAPGVRELIIGVLARGAAYYPHIRIHAFSFLSNHYHMLVSADGDAAQLPRFIGYINSNIAREISRINSWSGPFWGRRHRAIPILDEASMVARLRYVLAQGVKEGLVQHPLDWPGAASTPWLLGEALSGVWIYRDTLRRARQAGRIVDPATYTERYELHLEPLPCWRDCSRGEIADRARALIMDVIRDAMIERRGRAVLGADAVVAQGPHDRPEVAARSPAPVCHAATSAIRRAFHTAYAAFTAAFRAASRAARSAHASLPSRYPGGCFPSPLAFVGCVGLSLPVLGDVFLGGGTRAASAESRPPCDVA